LSVCTKKTSTRVSAWKRAAGPLLKIKATYTRKRQERDAYEAARIAKLQDQLCAEVKREQKQFNKAKRKYASFVNEETLPLLQQAGQYFASAIERAERAGAHPMAMAAR